MRAGHAALRADMVALPLQAARSSGRPLLLQVLFDLARYHAPSTIFLDELDALMTVRGGKRCLPSGLAEAALQGLSASASAADGLACTAAVAVCQPAGGDANSSCDLSQSSNALSAPAAGRGS